MRTLLQPSNSWGPASEMQRTEIGPHTDSQIPLTTATLDGETFSIDSILRTVLLIVPYLKQLFHSDELELELDKVLETDAENENWIQMK